MKLSLIRFQWSGLKELKENEPDGGLSCPSSIEGDEDDNGVDDNDDVDFDDDAISAFACGANSDVEESSDFLSLDDDVKEVEVDDLGKG